MKDDNIYINFFTLVVMIPALVCIAFYLAIFCEDNKTESEIEQRERMMDAGEHNDFYDGR